ncbi:hypothetical protein [Pedomonas mirosovicensis]|uniref:hypothetical protein n=1 Tax=Pedomonas mirosovicensis TaxID=2908641 RepID=UPI002167C77B|nr:hypothetical protein [Pedomonas mirosovicensis]MCH8685915.1 hypothetical protein [Pedomonas mirosovicensis]
MTWTMLRLEKARTGDQPEGDPSYAYIVHVALTEDGSLDEEAMGADPRRATVTRYKAGEEDCHGWLTRMKDRSWGFSYTAGDDDDEPIAGLEFHKLTTGEYVTIKDHTTGEALPFRIITSRPQP